MKSKYDKINGRLYRDVYLSGEIKGIKNKFYQKTVAFRRSDFTDKNSKGDKNELLIGTKEIFDLAIFISDSPIVMSVDEQVDEIKKLL